MFHFFLCLFAKLSLEAHCHAFVTIEGTKRQANQLLLFLTGCCCWKKVQKWKLIMAVRSSLQLKLLLFLFFFYLPINNCYHIIHYLFLEAHSFSRASLSENCSLLGTAYVRGQISEHIFAPNESYCLYTLSIIYIIQNKFLVKTFTWMQRKFNEKIPLIWGSQWG